MAKNNRLPKGRDVSVPIEEVVRAISLYGVLLLVVPLVPFVLLYGFNALLADFQSVNGWIAFLLISLVFLVAHEGFHAIGWKYWGEIPWSAIKFGIKWEALAPYAHATAPMPARAYRLGALLPGVMTGLIPYLMALVTGNGLMTVIGAVMISGAVGDLYVLWVMRDISPDARVLDHPENVGCIVVGED